MIDQFLVISWDGPQVFGGMSFALPVGGGGSAKYTHRLVGIFESHSIIGIFEDQHEIIGVFNPE